MNRFASLLEKYQDGEETPEEAEELAALLRGDELRSRQLYDALMLEADLYESYGGVVRLPADVRKRWTRVTPRLVIGWTVAVFMLIGLAVLLFGGRPTPQQQLPAPAAPRPLEPKVPDATPRQEPRRERRVERDHDDHDERREGSKENESEREFQKGMREVERKRLEGRTEEAEKKLREIEREREKKRREQERRVEDR
jgi:hypothetical protein